MSYFLGTAFLRQCKILLFFHETYLYIYHKVVFLSIGLFGQLCLDLGRSMT